MGMNISIAFIDRTFLLRALYIVYCTESSGLYTTEHVDAEVPSIRAIMIQCNTILLSVYCNCFKVDSNYGVYMQ